MQISKNAHLNVTSIQDSCLALTIPAVQTHKNVQLAIKLNVPYSGYQCAVIIAND